jgi:hypothetical protein
MDNEITRQMNLLLKVPEEKTGGVCQLQAGLAATRSQQERLAVAQIPHNLEVSEFPLRSAKSSLLCPVRFGQSTQLPAAGTS